MGYLRDMTTRIERLARQRAWPLIRRYGFDVLVVAAALETALELAFGRNHSNGNHPPGGSLWVLIPLTVPIFLPFFWRRRYPFAAPAAVYLYCAALSFFEGSLVTFTFGIFMAVLAAAFLMGMLPDRTQSVSGLGIALGAAAIVVHNDPRGQLGQFIFVSLIFTVVWVVGFSLGRKFAEADEARERAARAERERELRARDAVAEERARIARELHDVVGHSVSVMTVQASGVRRLLRPEQEREREALLIVERTGREALAEMRRMVGVLRRPEEAPALAPQPSLEHLDRLVEQARETGLPVDLRVEGEALELPAGVDLTAYRLVQEGLTNAIKHSHATRAEVVVSYGDAQIEVTVSDNGNGVGNGGGGGHGLVGMRERVSVYGGQLDAGPQPGGGYRLRAKLPVAS